MKRKYFRQRKRNKKASLLLLTVLAGIIILSFLIVERNLKPTIIAMSEIKARTLATQAINDIAGDKLTEEEYRNLIIVMTDNNGKVTMVRADSMLMNKLARETTMAIQQQLTELDTNSLSIPIANIFGSQILANTGPKINVKIQPIGSVRVDFKSESETTGINMTKQKMYLFVETNIRIVAPLIRNDVEVSTHVPISETIIVSDVSTQKII